MPRRCGFAMGNRKGWRQRSLIRPSRCVALNLSNAETLNTRSRWPASIRWPPPRQSKCGRFGVVWATIKPSDRLDNYRNLRPHKAFDRWRTGRRIGARHSLPAWRRFALPPAPTSNDARPEASWSYGFQRYTITFAPPSSSSMMIFQPSASVATWMPLTTSQTPQRPPTGSPGTMKSTCAPVAAL